MRFSNKTNKIIILLVFVGVVYLLWPKVSFQKWSVRNYPDKKCSCLGYETRHPYYSLKHSGWVRDICLGVVYDCGQLTSEEFELKEWARKSIEFEKSRPTSLGGGYYTNGHYIGSCVVIEGLACHIIEEADPDSFEYIGGAYAKDKNNVYKWDDVLEGEDSDGDGLSIVQELEIGTSPTNSDTDNDGYSDGEEVSSGNNPLVAYVPITPQSVINDLAKALSDKDVTLFLSVVGESFGGTAGMTAQEIESTINELAIDGRLAFHIIRELSWSTEIYYRARVKVFMDGRDITIDEPGKNEITLSKEEGDWKVIDIELDNFK